MKHPVTNTRNQKVVYVDLVASEAAAQIAQKPYLLDLAASLLATSTVSGKHVWVSHDLGRPIGNCDVIETVDGDSICYAKLLKSDVYVRFVKRKRLELTSLISIELNEVEGEYSIRQIVLGAPLPALPDDENATEKSRAFWSTHALLWGDWPIKGRTATTTCPWPDLA